MKFGLGKRITAATLEASVGDVSFANGRFAIAGTDLGMDYCMPRADEVPFCNVQFNPVPTKTNPLGIKGVGEAGTVGSMPAVMSALLDALRPVGVTDLHMPASPHRVWQAIRAARIETDSAQSAA